MKKFKFLKLPDIILNILYSSFTNGMALIISVISTLIIPKLVGIEIYSYYQLYIFYIGYVAIANFGLIEGVYLRYGGKRKVEFDDLELRKLSTQYWILQLFQIILYLMLFIIALFIENDSIKLLVLLFVCIAACIINPRYFPLHILLAIGETKKYSTIIIIEKIISITLTILLSIIFKADLFFLLLSDLIAKVIVNIICYKLCNEYIFQKFISFKSAVKEMKSNINIGIKMLISSYASIMIMGVMRFGIEKHWDIIAFGKVSLSISLSNMLLQFVNAISIVIYPSLKRLNISLISDVYKHLRFLISIFILSIMAFYYPISKILLVWLPQYNESIKYLAVLLPICFFECKMSMLIVTFFRVIRKEKTLLKCNALSLGISIILIIISTILLNSLDIAVLCILITLACKCIISELALSKILLINLFSSILREVLIITIFIILNWKFGLFGFIIYICLISYILIKNKVKLINSIKYIRSVIKNEL